MDADLIIVLKEGQVRGLGMAARAGHLGMGMAGVRSCLEAPRQRWQWRPQDPEGGLALRCRCRPAPGLLLRACLHPPSAACRLPGLQVAEQGKHAELVERGGLYAELWQRQQESATGASSAGPSSRPASRPASMLSLAQLAGTAGDATPPLPPGAHD